jgi:ribosome biogenesis protein NSA1
MAASPSGLVSTAFDRYARVHSTYPPPAEAGQPQDDKGAVLEKVYMKSIPTCVSWDEDADADDSKDDYMRRDVNGSGHDDEDDDGDGDDEDVWEGMQVVQDSEDESNKTQAYRRRKAHK